MIEAKILITLGKCVMISKPLWIQSYLYQVLYFVVVLKQEGKGQEQPLKEWYDHAAAKSLQSCPTLCDPTDGSPPGSPIPGILQARTLQWVVISFSNAWKWSRSVVSDPQRPHGLQPSRLLRPWDFPGRSTGVGCHCLLRIAYLWNLKKNYTRELSYKTETDSQT